MNDFEKLFLSYWYGEKKLWKAFWLIGMLGRIIVATIIILFSTIFTSIGLTWSIKILSIIFMISYVIWSFVSIWRCAFNVKNKNWGYVARLFITLDVIAGLYLNFIILKNNSISL